jgi:hypothetical protein
MSTLTTEHIAEPPTVQDIDELMGNLVNAKRNGLPIDRCTFDRWLDARLEAQQ